MHDSSFARSGARSRSVGTPRSILFHLAVILAPSLGLAPGLAAQAGTVGGTVVSGTGAPLAAAQVRVDGTDRQAMTNASGRFLITGLTGDEVTLDVRRIGYRPARARARLGETNLRIPLSEQSVSLAEVIVTGTAGGQTRREIGNAVTTVNAAEVTERGTISNVQQLLNGRAPGVFVNPATGNVGTGARIRVRGSSSMSLSNEPLIYVDGIRVNNQPATGPINQGFGSTSISRINDINPEDIESIEVIKGPAAATLYGTEASNGVIQIITKRGVSGRARWSFSTRQGVNSVRDPEKYYPVNYQTVRRQGQPLASVLDTVPIDIIALERSRGRDLFQTGRIAEYDFSTSGGSELFRYFAAAGLEDSEGIEPVNGVKRRTGRLNLTANPSDRLNFGINVGYTNGNITLPCEAGCGGRSWTAISATPRNDTLLTNGQANPRRGFHSGLPEAYDAFYEFYQFVDRFTGSVQAQHQITPWLRHRVTAGTDRTKEENSELGRRMSDSLFRAVLGLSANGALGYRDMTFRSINNYTVDYSANAVFDLSSAFKSTTAFGTQYYRNWYEISCASGSGFASTAITTVSGTTSTRGTCHDIEEDATLGVFIQEQLGWNDRLFATAAIRADDNSAFGQNFDRVYYPKFSLAWVISEEPFWRWPVVDALKLRAAYGESGKQPINYSALPSYISATGPADVPTITPQSIGNLDLGPERSKEIEVGFDLGALRDRLGLEFSYYRKRTEDAILERVIPPSAGIPATQPFNAGRVRNWGVEALLRSTPWTSDRVRWDLTFGYATNDSRVEDLNTPENILELRRVGACPGYVIGTTDPATCPVDDFVLASTGTLPPRHQVGYPIGSYFQKRVVSAEFNATGTAINVMCDDGKGSSVACSSAPFVFLGRTSPRVEGSVGNTLTLFQNLRAFALVDFKRDYRKVDGTTRVRCVVNIRCRENFYPTEFDPVLIAGVQAGLDVLPNFYIQDAGFAKLREISLSYTLPNGINTRYATFSRAVITLAGRNLRTWTDYTGMDPEAFFLGGSRGGSFSLFEQTTNPQPTHWILGVNLDW